MEVKENDHRLFETTVAAAFHRHVTLTLPSAEHGSAAVSKNGVTLSPPYVFHEGETGVLTATHDVGYGLQYWSGSNSSTENPYSLVMNGDKTMPPNFSQTLTLTAVIDKPSGDSGAAPALDITNTRTDNTTHATEASTAVSFLYGDYARAQMTPGGYDFSGWILGTGANTESLGAHPEVAFPMAQDETLTAVFDEPGAMRSRQHCCPIAFVVPIDCVIAQPPTQ